MFRKKHSTESDWQKLWDSCLTDVTEEETIALKDRAEELIEKTFDSKTLIGYTGGKDSLVLQHLCEDCLAEPKFLNVVLLNEYPKFDEWCLANMPKDTVILEDHHFSFEFLNDNPNYLFPVGAKEKSKYVSIWTHERDRFMTRNGYSKLITGKRIQDGNVCGFPNEFGCKSTSTNELTQFNPIADWTHSQLFAYIKRFDIELPPIYKYPDGFRQGTHAWTKEMRINNSYKETFDRINKIDDSIIPSAASRLRMAEMYLNGTLNI